MITVTNEDNMALMARYSDNHFELAVVDPEYGIGEAMGQEKSRNQSKGRAQTKTKYTQKAWDKTHSPIKYFQELKRVSKNQIVWGANHFISKIPFDSSCWIVWDKDNTGDFADCELAYTSFKTAVRKFVFRWNGMLQQDMKNKQIRIHPTEKPVKLYEWLLMNYANKGDKIIDTHGGSLSIAIACHNLGYDLTACELDKEYFDASMKRLKQHQAQTQLFL